MLEKLRRTPLEELVLQFQAVCVALKSPNKTVTAGLNYIFNVDSKSSKMPISTILLLIYEFFRRSSFAEIHKKLGIYSQAVADWHRYASDVLIEHIVVNTEKLGREGKIGK
ncbi:hypothetical protein TNCV_653251 [Trichonephila clavipes]|nr:hypothetical protein TNCV_653251 [Trichonephila clavipes]